MKPKGMTEEEEEAGIPRESVIPQKSVRREGAERVRAEAEAWDQRHKGRCSKGHESEGKKGKWSWQKSCAGL